MPGELVLPQPGKPLAELPTFGRYGRLSNITFRVPSNETDQLVTPPCHSKFSRIRPTRN